MMHCATEFDIVEREGLRLCGSWTAGSAWEDHDSSIDEVLAHAREQTLLAPNVLTVPCTVPVGDARQAGTSSDVDTYACRQTGAAGLVSRVKDVSRREIHAMRGNPALAAVWHLLNY